MQSSAFYNSWFLTGATASGKSAVGIELARLLGGEIVSMDSMAVYRGMDIGTAKPTTEQRAAVPHHLVDCVDPDEDFDLARYVEAAESVVKEIENRGKTAIFVGGTPLYLKGLLRGIFQGPSVDPELRKQLAAKYLNETEENNGRRLHEEVKKVDPEAAERLHPNDTKRLLRALEVFLTAGAKISDLQKQFDVGRSAEECKVFVLDWPKEILNERIDRRVEEMFAEGLAEEVRALLKRYKTLSKTAEQAVGYRETIEHLAGKISSDECIEAVKLHTRQLAKRQRTWFRSLSECRFIAMDVSQSAKSVVERVFQADFHPHS